MTASTTRNGRTATSKQILVPDFQRGEMVVRIRGKSPLMTNRPGPLTMGILIGGQGPKLEKSRRVPRDPQAEFEDHIHRDSEGRCCFPASGIKQAMIDANQRYVAEKQTTMLKGAVIIVGRLLPIESPNAPLMATDWVRLPQGMNRPLSVAYRPVFWPWEIALRIRFNASVIGAEQILQMLRAAGEMVGIGAWRLEKDGEMGSFELVEGEVEVEYLR